MLSFFYSLHCKKKVYNNYTNELEILSDSLFFLPKKDSQKKSSGIVVHID